MAKLLFFDWDGTLAKKSVSELASSRRFKWLDITQKKDMHDYLKNDSHYVLNKKAISNYTGLNVEDKEVTGLMTDLFKYHYLGVVNELGMDVFYPGVFSVLKKLKNEGFELVIVTALVTDIITNALKILGVGDFFKGVVASNRTLDRNKTDSAREAVKLFGKPLVFFGDRMDDMLAGISVDAKTVFCEYGHGELKDFVPDFSVKSFEEILKFVIPKLE